MNDELYGGNTPDVNPQETDTPDIPASQETAAPQTQQENAPAPSFSNEGSVNQGEYHYNRQQYSQQFGSTADYNQDTLAQMNNPSVQQGESYNNNYNGNYNNNYNNNNYGNNYNGNNYGYGGYNQNMNNPQQYNYQQEPDNNQKKNKNPGMKVFVALIAVIAVLAAALMVAVFMGSSDDNKGGNTASSQQENESAAPEKKPDTDNVGDVEVLPGTNNMGDAVTVANVASEYNVGILVYSKNSLYTEGSGVLLKEDDDGKYTYVVTCAHVVNYRDVALSVLTKDGDEYAADLVGMDTRTDLAVLRIEASGLRLAEIADSDNLLVGQAVYAVGNPGGSEFFGSVTDGIISAIDRPISSSTGYEMECIQHTAAINPGNSGGALVNGEGQLIGINSMKIASTEYEGMGFSVPSSVMVEVFNSIIDNGYVAGRAKLGISYTTPSSYSQTYSMYVQMKELPTGTIVVAEVNEDSDLADKDVIAGDMITHVNGKPMTDSGMLSEMIENMSAGDTLTLTIVRVNTDDWSQTERDITVKLVEDKGTGVTADTDTPDSSAPDNFSGDIDDWYDFFKEYYGY